MIGSTFVRALGLVIGALMLVLEARSDGLKYDASSGTLPEDQGFGSYYEGGPEVTLVDGYLHYDTTDAAGQIAYWSFPSFTCNDDSCTIKMEARVVSSGYEWISGCCGRAGLSLLLRDAAGYIYWIGIGEDSVFLTGDSNGNRNDCGAAEVSFDTTDGFHTYRIDTSVDGATLSIDGAPLASVARCHYGGGNYAFFGDGTYYVGGEVYVRFVEIDSARTGPSILKQPVSVLLSAPGEPAIFSIVADGSPKLEFQWRKDGTELVDGGNVSGATSANLSVVAGHRDIGVYDCVVTNDLGQVTSPGAILGIRGSCAGDMDGSGAVDFNDIDGFVAALVAGLCE